MRCTLRLLCLLALAPVALASEVEHAGTYLGWGGTGEQVFRHRVSVARNNVYSDRSMLVLVDDLKRRGPRLGIQRFTVEYAGGDGNSMRILNAIHKKPYEYVLVRVYETPQSPRMARVVVPQPRGVKATFRFFRNRRRLPSGEIDSGLIPELTRTMDCAMLEQLPAINPLRDPSIRKPRKGEVAAAPVTPDAAAVESPAPPPEVGGDPGVPEESRVTMGDIGTGGAPLSANDPRIELARKWAQRVSEEMRSQETEGSRPPTTDRPAQLDVGLSGAPSDVPASSGGRGMQAMEDTPEMQDAERRAAALAEKVGLDDSVKVEVAKPQTALQ